MLEIQIVLAMVLSRFRLEFLPNQIIDRQGTIVSAPQNGLRMKICPPDREFHRGVGGVRGNILKMVELSAEVRDQRSGAGKS